MQHQAAALAAAMARRPAGAVLMLNLRASPRPQYDVLGDEAGRDRRPTGHLISGRRVAGIPTQVDLRGSSDNAATVVRSTRPSKWSGLSTNSRTPAQRPRVQDGVHDRASCDGCGGRLRLAVRGPGGAEYRTGSACGPPPGASGRHVRREDNRDDRHGRRWRSAEFRRATACLVGGGRLRRTLRGARPELGHARGTRYGACHSTAPAAVVGLSGTARWVGSPHRRRGIRAWCAAAICTPSKTA